jgi:formate dehydrogenase
VVEGEPDIAPLTIRVCDALTCAMLGAEKLLHGAGQCGPGSVVRAPVSGCAMWRRWLRSVIIM